MPVDPADVCKMMLKENLKPFENKIAEYREYFWGGIDPYRIKLSEGRDLTLNPPQTGRPLNYFMYPFAEIGKKTIDWLDPRPLNTGLPISDYRKKWNSKGVLRLK